MSTWQSHAGQFYKERVKIDHDRRQTTKLFFSLYLHAVVCTLYFITTAYKKNHSNCYHYISWSKIEEKVLS